MPDADLEALMADYGLTEEQAEAVAEQEDTLLLACPGSGKTRTLVARAVERVRAGRRVVLVTFTRAAAGEMQERIWPQLDREQRRLIAVGTFDGLVARQARRHLQPARPPSVMERNHLVNQTLATETGNGLTFREAADLIEEANRRRFPVQAEDQASQLWQVYAGLMRAEGLMDFADTARAVLDAMAEGTIRPFGADELLVDEFQDADTLQLDWVRAHALNGTTVMAVGDDDQSIYGWRAAMGAPGMRVLEDDLGAQRRCLTQCYRCPPEVLEPAVALVDRNRDRLEKAVVSRMDPGRGEVAVRYASSTEHELSVLSDELPRLVGPNETVGVLARTNRIADDAEMALSAMGWTLRRLGGRSIWETEGAGLVTALVEAITGAEEVGLRGLGTVGRWLSLPGSAIEAARRRLAAPELAEDEPANDLEDLADAIRGRWRNQAAEDPDRVLHGLREWLQLQSTDSKGPSYTVATAQGLLDALIGKEGTLRARFDRARRAGARSDADPEEGGAPLTVATLHSAKGLEFDVVWIFAVDVERVPHKDAGDTEEERRLLYVGMTRAQRVLRLSTSSPSPFLHEAGL